MRKIQEYIGGSFCLENEVTLQGCRHPILCLVVCHVNNRQEEGCMVSALRLHPGTPLLGDRGSLASKWWPSSPSHVMVTTPPTSVTCPPTFFF